MTEVRKKWPHSEDTGILAVWYDFDDQDRPTPVLFECNSSNLSVTVDRVHRGFSFGGSCDSDILSYVQLHHSPTMTQDAGLRLVHDCTSIAAGRANAERRNRATGDDCRVQGWYHARVLLAVKDSREFPLIDGGPIVPLLIQ
ncbi:hypothetical protein MKW98_007764 [Papaver atlanticum]|uniref:Uncharacterized protein n=1 Tax=Papaver atlanticum TaxID=357466 RepID=A0AAD4RY42_9MAGN|nr:hypothetical protein MKW98_007764 [Papaver atlanticum]